MKKPQEPFEPVAYAVFPKYRMKPGLEIQRHRLCKTILTAVCKKFRCIYADAHYTTSLHFL